MKTFIVYFRNGTFSWVYAKDIGDALLCFHIDDVDWWKEMTLEIRAFRSFKE